MEPHFVAALLDRARPLPEFLEGVATPRTERGFEVYRNNYRVNLREALLVTYPVTAQLVGEAFFAAMINVFVTRHPPRSPVLIEYGAELPAFISGFEPAASVPYLADVARLEAAWSNAYHAAEYESLQAAALAAMDAEALAASRVLLHPSTQMVRSPYPVASIWESHRSSSPAATIAWEPEDVLVVRPEADVLVLALQPGHATFLAALHSGQCIADAADAARQDAIDFDAGAALVSLFNWGAVASLTPTD